MFARTFFWAGLFATAAFGLAASPVAAQRNDGGRNFGAGLNITVQGVYVDAKNVLRVRTADAAAASRFRRDVKLKQEFVSISLPKLFAEVKRLTAAGKTIPDRLRNLDGLVKLRYVIVDAKARDLIIAGPAEPIDARNPLRPLGKRTGRPVLQLDDLVVALRSVGPGSRTSAFGCTLLQDPKSIERVAALQKRLRRARSVAPQRLQLAMREAFGPLTAKFFGVPADTRFAFVCVEADYQMKRISLALERPPIRGLPSYLALSSGTSQFNRFWFVADYPPLNVSTDGTVFEVPERGLKLLASNSPDKVQTTNPAAAKFAESFTKHLPALEQAQPVFADLQNLADLAVLAALVDSDKLHRKAGWDLSWLQSDEGYRVRRLRVPKTAETLVNIKKSGRRIVTVAGGVQMSPRKFAAKRKTSAMPGAAGVSRDFRGDWSRRVARSR
jgi:Protein of unknown function (DUF1598)